MPRSSRHKSHKHSSRDGKEHSESEKEDAKKTKDRNNVEGLVGVCRDSSTSEKWKLSKEVSARDNGSMADEYVASKRRKEKAGDRWTGGGDEEDGGAKAVIKDVKGEIARIDGDKSKPLADSKRIDGDKSKPLADMKMIDGEKSKPLVDSKSKSSRRHESVGEKKDNNVSKSTTTRVDSNRKSDKDLGPKEVQQNKDSKDKERGLQKERKIIQDIKREKEATVHVEVARKQGED